MRTLSPFLFTLAIVSIIGAGLGCKRSAEARSQDATTLVRAMHQEFQAAEKKEVDAFKAMPEADAIQLLFDKNFDGWCVSPKKLSANDDAQEKALIDYQKDSKDEALIGELRLYAKKTAKDSQGLVAEFESRLVKAKDPATVEEAKQELESGKFKVGKYALPLNAEGRKVRENLLKSNEYLQKILPLEIDYFKQREKIANDYEVKLSKLLV